jgi:hypothetical protein
MVMLSDVTPRRLARRWGWHRNEMSRGSDRAERRLTVALLLVFALGAPLLGSWAGGGAYRSEQKSHDAVRRGLARVDAVLLDPATQPGPTDGTGLAVDIWVARVGWTAPAGGSHVGFVQLTAPRPAGDHIGLWIDEQGKPSSGPGHSIAGTKAALAATAAGLCLLGVVFIVRVSVRVVLDRRRMRSWQDEWDEVEPGWTSHQ